MPGVVGVQTQTLGANMPHPRNVPSEHRVSPGGRRTTDPQRVSTCSSLHVTSCLHLLVPKTVSAKASPKFGNGEVRECFMGNTLEFHLELRRIKIDTQEGHFEERKTRMMCKHELCRFIGLGQKKS